MTAMTIKVAKLFSVSLYPFVMIYRNTASLSVLAVEVSAISILELELTEKRYVFYDTNNYILKLRTRVSFFSSTP